MIQKQKLIYIWFIVTGVLVMPLWIFGASLTGGENEIGNPIKSQTFDQLLSNFFNKINPVVMLVAMFFVLLSGYKFLTAQGEPGKIKEAQQMFLWTAIGVAIIVGAQLIIKIIKDIIL